ncbi:MAG TPA: AEC family transporter, partial [Anaerolineae bacterium]
MLSVLLSILVDDILPILLVAAVGFLLARILHAESRTLSRITFYALSPGLIFNLLTTSRLNA